MEFVKVQDRIMMHQQKYISELLNRFEMENCKPVSNSSKTNARLDECSE
jgi:hypothetical protein